jgi:peroxisomal 2,4-dienoyl-CoA reductase
MERLLVREDQDRVTSSIPLGRFGSVKEIADATIYLFSESGNYVNGSTVVGE